MGDYVDREAVLKIVERRVDLSEKTMHAFQELISLPSADVSPVVHGSWEPYHKSDFGWDEYGVRCTVCKLEVEDADFTFPRGYCPNCGAKMDGGTNNENQT